MVLKTIGKVAVMLALGASLAGCIDASVDVEVTSATTAKTTLTQVMSADFYAMVKMSAEDKENGETEKSAAFCVDGTLTEEKDGSATCTLSEEGPFATLGRLGEEKNAITFTPAGAGLVRVALPTAQITNELRGSQEIDAETQQMLEAFFAGRTITIHIAGEAITETNLELAKDKKSAEIVIPFLDLLNGSAELPEEFFAVVRTP